MPNFHIWGKRGKRAKKSKIEFGQILSCHIWLEAHFYADFKYVMDFGPIYIFGAARAKGQKGQK